MSEQYEYKGYTIRVERDEDPMNPRTEWDNFGTMVCFHRRYKLLGDEDHGYRVENYSGWDELQKAIEEEDVAVILPIYMYDHGGVTIQTRPFSCPWDSGRIGFVFVSKDKVRKEYGKQRLSQKTLELAENILIREVETYDQYLTGDVWGFIIGNDDDDHIESCWGFFGYDYCKQEAESIVDYMVKKAEEEAAERKRIYAAMPCCQP